MADIKHTFVNPKADGGDATITRPSDWNAVHVWPNAIDVGTTVLDTDGEFMLQLSRLQVSSTNRLTLAGDTTRVVVFGQTDARVPNVIGWPKQVPDAPWRLPGGYEMNVIGRMSLTGTIRGVIEGNCDLNLMDPQGTGSRLTITGRG